MNVTFPDLARFDAMVTEMAALTGRERSVVVRNVARDFCRAALRNTPMADRVHKKTSLNYFVKLHHRYTGQVVVFPGTLAEAEKWSDGDIRRIPNRGFAKSGWMGCLRKLGVPVRASGDASPERQTGALLYNEVLQVQARDVDEIEVANQTPPIEPLDAGGPHNPPHNIGARSLAEALARMDKALDKLRKKQDARWRR